MYKMTFLVTLLSFVPSLQSMEGSATNDCMDIDNNPGRPPVNRILNYNDPLNIIYNIGDGNNDNNIMPYDDNFNDDNMDIVDPQENFNDFNNNNL